MKKIIYINQDAIQIAEGKGQRTKCTHIDLATGTILNGVIVNEGEILEKLSANSKHLAGHQLTLIIDSSNIMVKKLTMPQLAPKRLAATLRGEFEVVESQNYLYDACHLGKSTTGHTYVAAASQQDFVEGYIRLFQSAGLKLERIDVLLNSVVKYATQHPQLQGQTFLLNIVQQNSMLSLLFGQGEYQLANRHRLLNEPGSPGFVAELYGKLSTMLQFSQSQKLQSPITASYYVGIDEENLSELSAYLGEGDLQVLSHAVTPSQADCFYALSGLTTYKQDVDLLAQFKQATKKTVQVPGLVWQGLFLAVLVAGMAYLYLDWSARNRALEDQILPLEAYLTSSEALDAQSEIQYLQYQESLMRLQIEEHHQALNYLISGNILTPQALSTIYSTLPIDQLNYALIGGTITINGQSQEVSQSADYVEMLRNSGYFTNIDYVGYVRQTGEVPYHVFTFQAQLVSQEVAP